MPNGLLGRIHFTALAPILVLVILLGVLYILGVLFSLNPSGTPRGAVLTRLRHFGEVLASRFPRWGEASIGPAGCTLGS